MQDEEKGYTNVTLTKRLLFINKLNPNYGRFRLRPNAKCVESPWINIRKLELDNYGGNLLSEVTSVKLRKINAMENIKVNK